MSRISKTFGGLRTILTLLVFALLTVLIIVPGYLNVADASVERPRDVKGTEAGGLPKMWDIREAEKGDALDKLTLFRRSAGTNAAEVADVRAGFVQGEEALKRHQPNIKIEYNTDIRIPEVISPKFDMNHVEFLTGPNGGGRVDSLRNFLKANNQLVGVDPAEIDDLKVGADYTNPDGNLSFVRLEQEFNGIPVFRGEVNAGFTKDGRIIRIINNLAPGVDQSNVSMDFGDPTEALKIAAEQVGFTLSKEELRRNDKASTGNRVLYGNREWMPTAEKMYFPTEPGVAVPAWRVLMWRGDAYYVIVEPTSGTVLWYKNLTDEQSQPATLQVYTNSPAGNAAYINVADSVMPLSPYISNPVNDPTVNAQGTYLARSNVTLIGNEGALSFNNNGWITDNTNVTDGNATEAGSDIDTTNGVDAVEQGDTACPGAGCRTFTSAWNPQPGNPAPGDDPLGTAPENIRARRGANIEMFYVMNLYHDELYKRGFNEQARNFQASNFTRGGAEADRISSEGQDQTTGSSCPSTPCTDNANFSTPADGGRGRMQMYIWDGFSPRRDGTGDADIIIHEVTHGTSNRIHGNGAGLGNQGGMMGEGWGDFYAHTMLAQPSDAVDGVYALSGYSTAGVGGLTGSFYYGIRRFPTAVISLTGGPARAGCNNAPCPHNPLTFKHINSNCDTTLGTSSAITSAFPRNPVFGPTGNCSQVHNAGEIWKIALWEVRSRMVTRLGFSAGTTRVLQAVTDGMKLSPISPTFLQGRDAIIAAAAALSFQGSPELSADITDVREGFRVRGMGFSASVQSSSAVTEAFDFPNVTAVDPFSVSEALSGADGDGFPEPGENVLLSVAVKNPNTGSAITNVQVNINGGTNVSYGTIADGATVTHQIPYTIPAGAACGSMHQVTINVSSSVGAQTPVNKEFRLGAPVGGAPATFSNNTLINLPNGQPGTTSGPAAPYPSNITVSGLSGNKVMTLGLTGITHTFPGDLDFLLVGPGNQKYIFLSDSGSSGPVSNLNISFSDTAAALPSSSQWVAGTFKPTNTGADDAFAAPAPAGPYTNAAPGGSDTFASVFGTNGAGLNGSWSLYVVDDSGVDSGTLAGWSLTFEANDFACVTGSAISISGRVVTTGGRGIANAIVSLTDGATTRVVRTSTFGYFVFANVPQGIQYTVTPRQKRYTFAPQTFTPAADVTGLTFTGT